jgi:hypothetical protein
MSITTDPIWVTDERPAPIACQAWCAYGDGHPNQFAATDQACVGMEHLLPLSLEPLVNHHNALSNPVADFHPEHLTLYLVKDYGREPAIHLGKGEATGVSMTPAEAVALAQQLLTLTSLLTTQPEHRPEPDYPGSCTCGTLTRLCVGQR